MMYWLPLILLGLPLYVTAESTDMPEQAARGKAIFFDAAKKTHCGTCHQLNKEGTAIGPDLSKIGRMSPRAVLVSMMATRTMYVKEIELKNKKKFPAMIASEQGGQMKVFNLAQLPPEAMTFEKSAVQTVRDNATWKHPPESTGYSDEQIADVISYIRFIVFHDTKGVSPDEVK